MGFITHPSIDEVLQVPGYLFWNPTALTSEATWGTKLGFCESGISFQPNQTIVDLQEEETGEETTMRVFCGGTATIIAVLQNYNATALSALFPGQTTSARAYYPGSIKPGTDIASGTTYAKPLLFVPQDLARDPAIVFQKASPNIVKTARIVLSHSKKSLFPCVFTAIRKSSAVNGIYDIGILSGLGLV